MPPGSLPAQQGWCIYLLSLFLQAARAAAISFSLQEVYLAVSFLSFPVSFLQKDITVFSVQQLIRRMLLLKWRQTYFLSQTQPCQGHREWDLGVEKENLIFTHTSLVSSSSLKYFLQWDTLITSSSCVKLHILPRQRQAVQKQSGALYWHKLGVPLEGSQEAALGLTCSGEIMRIEQ